MQNYKCIQVYLQFCIAGRVIYKSQWLNFWVLCLNVLIEVIYMKLCFICQIRNVFLYAVPVKMCEIRVT